jgi:hypothetical protein
VRRRLADRPNLRAERAGADMPWMIERAVVDDTLGGSWDVTCAANMLLDDQYFVTPTWNMVENAGLVEGTHQTARAPSWTLEWEAAHRPDLAALRFPPVVADEPVLAAYRAFFGHGRRQTLVGVASKLRRAAGLHR